MDSDQGQGDLGFSRAQSYFDKSVTIRLLIGAFFALCLFLLLHFRQSYVETLEPDSLAEKYVVAQIDFAFPDNDATLILREEAGRDIGRVYRIDDAEIHEQITEFQKFITQNEEGSLAWSDAAEQSDVQNLAPVLSLFSDGLFQARFTDARTLGKIEDLPEKELPVPANHFFVFIPPGENDLGRLPMQFWTAFSKQFLAPEEVPPKEVAFLVDYFQSKAWQFDIDQGTEYSLRKLVQQRIPQKFTRIRAGERIIDQGERVSPRHLAMLQAMKDRLDAQRNLLDPVTLAGSLLMTLLILVVATVFLHANHRETLTSNRKLALLASVILLAFLLAKVTELVFFGSPTTVLDLVRFPLFVPFAAMLIANLLNLRLATFATIFLCIVFTMALAVDSVPFLVINILASMVAILSTRRIRRRKEVFIVCGKAWLASLVVILAFNLYENTAFSFSFLTELTSTFLFMLVSAVIVVGLLPMLESIFQIMTDITLMEFMDPGHPLLRRLTIEAPGTYQHSMVVGNLAESAAAAIGANGLFCRVATLYHDVGKLANPQYFTENQLGGIDMHQLLTPLESAQVIIAHVSEGVSLARKHSLPEQFIDIIKEHHGTTLVYYFYHKQSEMSGKESIDPKDFRYSGPKPRTKESTLIMIADTMEAASRCLDIFNEDTVSDLVDTLVSQKLEDGQFDDSLLTFEELGIVKNAMIKTLLAASHPRIKYPPHHPGEEG